MLLVKLIELKWINQFLSPPPINRKRCILSSEGIEVYRSTYKYNLAKFRNYKALYRGKFNHSVKSQPTKHISFVNDQGIKKSKFLDTAWKKNTAQTKRMQIWPAG